VEDFVKWYDKKVTAWVVRQEVAEAVSNGFDEVWIVSHHGFTDGAYAAADDAEIECALFTEDPDGDY
jgi:hypothetical protein